MRALVSSVWLTAADILSKVAGEPARRNQASAWTPVFGSLHLKAVSASGSGYRGGREMKKWLLGIGWLVIILILLLYVLIFVSHLLGGPSL
jgi:hypothetical protein